jgi:MarR-like DNA-binding transcriptional regulator SgrR of sgrS sRNA
MQKKLDLQKPRTDNGARFTQEFTDEQFVRAVKKCMEESTCTAAEVAAMVGCNPQHAKKRLLQLAEDGKVTKKMRGRIWGFRP